MKRKMCLFYYSEFFKIVCVFIVGFIYQIEDVSSGRKYYLVGTLVIGGGDNF